MEAPDGIGPTGKHPEGSIGPDDDGELQMAVGTRAGKVLVHFGKTAVQWIGFPADKARELARLLLEKADVLEGIAPLRPHVELEPTSEFATMPLDGRARRWVGKTDEGLTIDVWIAALRVEEDDIELFEESALFQELERQDPATLADPAYSRPRGGDNGIDPRLVT